RGEAAVAVLNGLKVFTLTGSLGGVESIISYPAQMSHVFLSQEERKRRGIEDVLIRLSIGLEDSADLIADLDQALKGASRWSARRRLVRRAIKRPLASNRFSGLFGDNMRLPHDGVIGGVNLSVRFR